MESFSVNVHFKKTAVLLLCITACFVAQAQTTQGWADYTLNVPFKNQFLFSTQLSYRTIAGEQNKWREVEISPSVQWSIDHHIDIFTSFIATSTHQQAGYNTEELRPVIGMRYHFTPHRRIQLRSLLQFEQRNLYHQESDTWAISVRSRLRLESLIPINRKTVFENKLWYGLLDAEFFLVMDKQIDERYANQMRYRAGMGYRASYQWRFEFIYTAQFTRNNLDEGVQQASNIFRIRVKHFINKAKPVKQDPNHG